MAPRNAAQKDPERVRLGRLGALTLHASGKTNTAPARAAWEAQLATDFGIDDSLTADERRRRLDLAMRARMSRLAQARWSKKSATAPEKRRGAEMEETDESGLNQRPAA